MTADLALEPAIPSVSPAMLAESIVRTVGAEAIALAKDAPGPVRRVSVRFGDCHVEIELQMDGAGSAHATGSSGAADLSAVPAVVDDDLNVVVAPLVGTFYVAERPGAEPFVVPGQEVHPGMTLGIIEAMKLMNPIVADTAGRLVEVCVADGEPVEYDQPLFRIEPTG